ncbi:MAG TPA: aminomethyl-transferring glycine dehydrogenase subunit GcvPA [Candidatus Dormibacteraeota bacterium]|nr:aminomethyl-transferring glycine dehydrogenase subunit GcvPA [Candidatus Dormibacteraeota bacterium]
MPYLVHAADDRQRMLDAVGVRSMDDLLVDVPASIRSPVLDLPDGLSEQETMARVRELAGRNRVFEDRLCFRGGGVYRRFIPAAVSAVISKPEFYTAYTPYQPEASQGTLQAIFEFQTLIAELTDMDVANASLYDGATALAEAAMMAVVHTGRDKLVVAGYLHPEYVEVLRCYGEGRGFEVQMGLDRLGDDTAAVLFQQPNFLGLLEDAAAVTEEAHRRGALSVASVDPISLGLVSAPGEYGADIAVGEGQQLGLPPSFGGPHVGFIACRRALMRRLPGRLVGATADARGRRGFVLTLTAREQHIRRAKATSNICTNHSLCALAASVYLTYMGPEGLRGIAEVSYQRAHALAERLTAIPGIELAFPDRHFLNEFPLRMFHVEQSLANLRDAGILGGLPVGQWYPELDDVAIFCCTEVNDPNAIAEVVEVLSRTAPRTPAAGIPTLAPHAPLSGGGGRSKVQGASAEVRG